VAALICDEFVRQASVEVELLDVAEYYVEEMADFDYLILGISTWNVGQLQRDWDAIIEEFDTVNLEGKVAAMFGLGDQVGYPATFGDALFFLADKVETRGARVVGAWPIDGYSFTGSWAVRAGQFVGLMLDEDNQRELTETRVRVWVSQLVHEFGIVP
jgi:flavodoxin I